MFRYGIRMNMPEDYDHVNYYGRGPGENYSDRNNAALVGLYHQTVEEQFYPYIRPQENGLRSDLRWWEVTDRSNRGLRFYSDGPIMASALAYSIEELDDGMEKDQRHSSELTGNGCTNVCIDLEHLGLGCVNSWGKLPLEKYRVPCDTYRFRLMIRPVTMR